MEKSIIIIGAGMGGLGAGIYGQYCGFQTTILESHALPGGQCTSWKRKSYVFDPCLHNLNGFKADTRVRRFWEELGALPCPTRERQEFVSALAPDGSYFHNYLDPDRLEAHLKALSPEDSSLIDEYLKGIRAFARSEDWFGKANFGTFWDKLSLLPFLLPKFRYFRHTLRTFARRFKHPFLQKAFPLIRNSIPDIPLFGYLAEHASCVTGDILWPEGGALTLAKNMERRYLELGGTVKYRSKVVRILTENRRACGVVLEDGTELRADYVVSDADGRSTIQGMLGNRFSKRKVRRYLKPYPEDQAVHSAVIVFFGVRRDLSALPSSLIMLLDQPERVAGENCDHLHMQIYGFDPSMAPAGKGVIKVELRSAPAFFSSLAHDPAAYRQAKDAVARHVLALLEKQFPKLGEDVEIVDVCTLKTWEHYMGGSQGFNNFPRKYEDLTDIRNVIDFMFGLNKMFTLPGLRNFYFAGQWVTSMGSLFSNALTGRTVIQKICRSEGIPFKSQGGRPA